MLKSKKQTLARLILEKIAVTTNDGIDATLDIFFSANHPYGRFWRDLLGFAADYSFSKASFSTTLSRLRRDGLIKRHGSRKKSFWKITPKGLSFLKKKNKNDQNENYEEDGIIRIVCFDISEKERQKRNLIREWLKNSNYIQLQQSVWLGKRPLPENFIHLIHKLNINSSVHIFSINKEGTILFDKKLKKENFI